MSEYKLSKGCALPWNLDVRSKTYMAIRNGSNEPTGLVLVCTGTPSQRAAADYAVACANLMPKIAHDLKLFFARRAYNRSPVSEVDLKRLYNRIAELVGTAQIEEAELPD